MEQYKGKTVLPDIAIGKIWFYHSANQSIMTYTVENCDKEILRYQKAKEKTMLSLKESYEQALKEVGEMGASIFEAHQVILQDEEYSKNICNLIIQRKINAECAIIETQEYYAKIFAGMEDEFFKAREADVRDVSKRLLFFLLNHGNKLKMNQEPAIVVAKDLTPSETIHLEKGKVLGFVTETGSLSSHTAILARTMNLPALMGIPVQEKWNGRLAALDGENGILYIDPDEMILDRLRKRQNEKNSQNHFLVQMKGKETSTKSGKKISLFANVGSISDIQLALDNDAEGIGLFRSEFLYMKRESFPTEEEQFQQYKTAVEMIGNRKMIIRTMDIGADKTIDYFGLKHEENPAMGFRAIRICLANPHVFKTQLRAIYRASVYGDLSVMYPMITSLKEVGCIKRLVAEVKEELAQEGIPFKDIKQGIMIETPAAALISDELAKAVDFFSIGTNDLSQYTLAIDRQNSHLDSFYDPCHPAILKMIQMTVENGHKEGCSVGICGELAADTELAEKFIEMGLDEISVAPGFILPMRAKIRSL